MCHIWEDKMHKSLWQIQNSVRRRGVVKLPIPVRCPRPIGLNVNLPLGWRRLCNLRTLLPIHTDPQQ